jgi:hypothetical protein
MLDKLLYEEEVKRCAACFEQQFHYAVFYSYMKLREQEIRNVRRAAGPAGPAGRDAGGGGRAGGPRGARLGGGVSWCEAAAHARMRTRTQARNAFRGTCENATRAQPATPAQVMWVSECVAQDQKSRVNDGIVFIF